MRARLIAVLFFSMVLPSYSQQSCIKQSFEGEVRYGELYRHPLDQGLEFVLDPLASGWLVRVLPAGPRPPHDYAELATPPYASVTPLAISTDFSFRAQDAVAWNPRRFRYAPDRASFQSFLAAYTTYMSTLSDPKANRQAEAKLTMLVQGTPEAELRILDSRFIAGTADQAGLAATVASHLAETPHTVEDGGMERVSSLGRLQWIRFHVDTWTPVGKISGPKVTLCP